MTTGKTDVSVKAVMSAPKLTHITVKMDVETAQRLAGILGALNRGCYELYRDIVDVLEAHGLNALEPDPAIFRSVKQV